MSDRECLRYQQEQMDELRRNLSYNLEIGKCCKEENENLAK